MEAILLYINGIIEKQWLAINQGEVAFSLILCLINNDSISIPLRYNKYKKNIIMHTQNLGTNNIGIVDLGTTNLGSADLSTTNLSTVDLNIDINNNNKSKKEDNELKINKLNILLKNEKEKNEILTNENYNLKNKLNKLKTELDKLEGLNNIINKLNLELNDLKEKNKSLNIEITNLKSQKKKLSDSYGKNGITTIAPGERVIAVNFVSMGNQDIINYCMVCKNTDLFVKLEEKLYNDYPKFKDYETYFMVKARKILRFKSIDENKIDNNDMISIFIAE
jgi:FtsZ-binding cell division protein ZapB